MLENVSIFKWFKIGTKIPVVIDKLTHVHHTLSSSLKLRTTHLVLAALVLDTVGVPGLSTGRSCIGGAAFMSTVICKTFQILRKSKNTPQYWILFSLKNSTCIPTYKSFNKYPQNCKSLKPHSFIVFSNIDDLVLCKDRLTTLLNNSYWPS